MVAQQTTTKSIDANDEEEEIDVEEIELEGKKYYTTDKDNGIIYEY